MKTLFRYVLLLFVLGYSAEANAQANTPVLTFLATDMARIAPNSTQWKYNYVKCGGGRKVTSITISMINNHIAEETYQIAGRGKFESLGNDPKVCTYTFGNGISGDQVENFIKGLVFDQIEAIKGRAQYIHIYVDANPTKLPLIAEAKITAWSEHPDSTTHYYIWVPTDSNPHYKNVYNEAKQFYFQGMRGYLATITSKAEDELLTNISGIGGWSAGVRTPDDINDKRKIDNNPTRNDETAKNFKWACGPEAGVEYYAGPTGDGCNNAMDGAYCNFAGGEPNNAGGENIMQINFFNLGYNNRQWNDLGPGGHGAHPVMGYFIEFGGTDQDYTVGSKTYPGNPNYAKPTTKMDDDDDHWPGYDPNATNFSEAEVKERAMRSHVMVIQ